MPRTVWRSSHTTVHVSLACSFIRASGWSQAPVPLGHQALCGHPLVTVVSPSSVSGENWSSGALSWPATSSVGASADTPLTVKKSCKSVTSSVVAGMAFEASSGIASVGRGLHGRGSKCRAVPKVAGSKQRSSEGPPVGCQRSGITPAYPTASVPPAIELPPRKAKLIASNWHLYVPFATSTMVL